MVSNKTFFLFFFCPSMGTSCNKISYDLALYSRELRLAVFFGRITATYASSMFSGFPIAAETRRLGLPPRCSRDPAPPRCPRGNRAVSPVRAAGCPSGRDPHRSPMLGPRSRAPGPAGLPATGAPSAPASSGPWGPESLLRTGSLTVLPSPGTRAPFAPHPLWAPRSPKASAF